MNCGTCTYWVPNPSVGGGNCRRYAPRPSDSVKPIKWPATEATDFCGEWELSQKQELTTELSSSILITSEGEQNVEDQLHRVDAQ